MLNHYFITWFVVHWVMVLKTQFIFTKLSRFNSAGSAVSLPTLLILKAVFKLNWAARLNALTSYSGESSFEPTVNGGMNMIHNSHWMDGTKMSDWLPINGENVIKTPKFTFPDCPLLSSETPSIHVSVAHWLLVGDQMSWNNNIQWQGC